MCLRDARYTSRIVSMCDARYTSRIVGMCDARYTSGIVSMTDVMFTSRIMPNDSRFKFSIPMYLFCHNLQVKRYGKEDSH